MTTGVLPSITSPFRQKLSGGRRSRGSGQPQGAGGGASRGRAPLSHHAAHPYLKSMALSPMSIPVSTVDSSRSMMAPSS